MRGDAMNCGSKQMLRSRTNIGEQKTVAKLSGCAGRSD
jgi:hypothetical protein